jgi:hypothetical protein
VRHLHQENPSAVAIEASEEINIQNKEKLILFEGEVKMASNLMFENITTDNGDGKSKIKISINPLHESEYFGIPLPIIVERWTTSTVKAERIQCLVNQYEDLLNEYQAVLSFAASDAGKKILANMNMEIERAHSMMEGVDEIAPLKKLQGIINGIRLSQCVFRGENFYKDLRGKRDEIKKELDIKY